MHAGPHGGLRAKGGQVSRACDLWPGGKRMRAGGVGGSVRVPELFGFRVQLPPIIPDSTRVLRAGATGRTRDRAGPSYPARCGVQSMIALPFITSGARRVTNTPTFRSGMK